MPVYPPTSRRKCRYLVEWQMDGAVCTGFTHDISPTGMFVRTTHIPENGASVTLRLLLSAGRRVRLRGTVVRSYRVPANLRRYVASGFGVRLDEAPEEYFELLASLLRIRLARTG
ncbi:MAG TPA: PilZ domain-containing protein [Thermoanaerobaculia bacterium]|nr:PilZ domain-containing protein [Thermoanaerobaculia bacterium]